MPFPWIKALQVVSLSMLIVLKSRSIYMKIRRIDG